MLSRRRLLFAPFIAVPALPAAAPQRPSMARINGLIRQLKRIQQTWPDRAQEQPESLTPEQLAARIDMLVIVDKIHTLTLAELTEWIVYCVYWIGGDGIPTAERGKL